MVALDNPQNVNVIAGQAHFIKTVEDLREALGAAGSHLRFGTAFCEAGSRLIRKSGNHAELTGGSRLRGLVPAVAGPARWRPPGPRGRQVPAR